MKIGPEIRFYRIYFSIKTRTRNEKATNFHNYGGKGIKLCKRWLLYENFKVDMYKSYLSHVKKFGEKDTTIERLNVYGDYEPKNCTWETNHNQSRNKTNNKVYTLDGKTLCIIDWAKYLGISYVVLTRRIKRGWPLDKALTLRRQSNGFRRNF